MPQINITRKGWKCLRCNHEWFQKEMFNEAEKPITCPKCRSAYWDREKKK